VNEALQALERLLGAGAAVPRFPPSSRYHAVPLAVHLRADGTPVAHLRRRVVPPPERFATVAEHRVTGSERVDHLAATHLGDPELAWRLADANGVLRPAELEEVGRRVRITLPEGIPGGQGA
jgi:hypothetical protein